VHLKRRNAPVYTEIKKKMEDQKKRRWHPGLLVFFSSFIGLPKKGEF